MTVTDYPRGMHPCGVRIITVQPFEVERGDQFLGLMSVVESIVFDGALGAWRYMDRTGSVITTRKPWQAVQVLRGALTVDDTPPFGIERRLVLIKGGAGNTPECASWLDAMHEAELF